MLKEGILSERRKRQGVEVSVGRTRAVKSE
jgi:hypothetical protein